MWVNNDRQYSCDHHYIIERLLSSVLNSDREKEICLLFEEHFVQLHPPSTKISKPALFSYLLVFARNTHSLIN